MSPKASTTDLGELLMRATRGLRRRWAESLGPWNLTPHQVRALHVVGELGSPRLGTLADRLRIAPRSATEVVDALEATGLIVRQPDESDRRAISVALTDRGRQILSEVDAARGAAANEHFATLTATERTTLTELLAKLDHPPVHPR